MKLLTSMKVDWKSFLVVMRNLVLIAGLWLVSPLGNVNLFSQYVERHPGMITIYHLHEPKKSQKATCLVETMLCLEKSIGVH